MIAKSKSKSVKTTKSTKQTKKPAKKSAAKIDNLKSVLESLLITLSKVQTADKYDSFNELKLVLSCRNGAFSAMISDHPVDEIYDLSVSDEPSDITSSLTRLKQKVEDFFDEETEYHICDDGSLRKLLSSSPYIDDGVRLTKEGFLKLKETINSVE